MLSSCPVLQRMQTDRVLAWGALLAFAIFYSTTCIVLYTHHSTIVQQACDAVGVINELLYNHPCLCQLDSNCDHQISSTTKVVDDTAYSFASAPSWTRATVADGQFFGSKTSEPETPRLLKTTIFTYPTCNWRPRWGWSHWNLGEIILRHKTRVHGLSYCAVLEICV